MKKFVLLLLSVFFFGGITVYGFSLDNLKTYTGDGSVYYRNSDTVVQIPNTYDIQERDFRGVWISHFVSDVPAYTYKEKYMSDMELVFDVMEYYNLNAMIFHVRTHNNALYQSKLNPVAKWYSQVNFEEWDPLEWIISECHRRGIEFHAWLNPYRVDPNITYPSNHIASKPEYLLSGSGLILNPGEPKVREFVIDTCMELIENYDIDAIHFDDYFYIDKCDDTITRDKYNTEGLSTPDFRRKQVDLFIEGLSDAMHSYNEANNRAVQLGISPSGIYRNSSFVAVEDYRYDGDGNLTYPVGSNTGGFEHYGHYLYSDTKKWVDEEWIDYILPQSYWSFEQGNAQFASVMDWWSGVVRYKNVNLYSGMGLYKINENEYSWLSEKEAYNQVLYGTKYPQIDGHAIYSFKHLKAAYQKTGNSLFYENFRRVKENCWKKPAILPETRTYDPIRLESVKNLQTGVANNGYLLSFEPVKDAKFYVIYRSSLPLAYSADEVIDIIGSDSNTDPVFYQDNVASGEYYYGVKPLSATNTLGASSMTETDDKCMVVFRGEDGKILKIEKVNQWGSATPPDAPTIPGYTFTGWDHATAYIVSSITITATYIPEQYIITYLDTDGTVLRYDYIAHGEVPEPYIPVKPGFRFLGWDKELTDIDSDIEVRAIFEIVGPAIYFFADDEIVYAFPASIPFELPEVPRKEGYDRTEPVWSQTDFTNVTADIIVTAIYKINVYEVQFIGPDGTTLKTETVEWGKSATAPSIPEIRGYTFDSWSEDFSEVSSDMVIEAIYEKNSSCIRFSLQSAMAVFFAMLFVIIRKRR